MGKKSERIAELERELAAYEGYPHLQKTLQGLRREVVLRTQETRDLKNRNYLLWVECNALRAALRESLLHTHNFNKPKF